MRHVRLGREVVAPYDIGARGSVSLASSFRLAACTLSLYQPIIILEEIKQ
jgi:hypothetical protein